MCDRWLGPLGFDRFYADMGARPGGCSLDRIDNDGPYEPGNCRWASMHTQQRNKRDNRDVTHEGETMCVAAWAERAGLSRRTLAGRVASGWNFGVALVTPKGVGKRRAHRARRAVPTRVGRSRWAKSGLRGVHPSSRRWVAIITVDGKQVRLGTFADKTEAARVYDRAALANFGASARLNYPEEAA